MMAKWIASGALATGLTFACGGGSGGLDSGTKIVDLEPAELATLCEDLASQLGPERTIDCGGGETKTVGGEDASECVDDLGMFDPECPTTVGQYENCIDAFGGRTDQEICSDVLPTECAVVFDANCFGQ